jgi:hypothetical protein
MGRWTYNQNGYRIRTRPINKTGIENFEVLPWKSKEDEDDFREVFDTYEDQLRHLNEYAKYLVQSYPDLFKY